MAGKVWLVGAGPGDISLITVKGLECVKHADVIVYDRLVNPELFDFASENCEWVNVGKECNHHPVPQWQINQILVQHAKEGKMVVRLKSGDPYVFGRGGEEVQALVDENIVFEVVPGVTSAIGGLTCAGIPVTHRDYASSFHVITGHLRSDKEKDPVNWQVIARLEGTIVILMGMSNLPNITNDLILYGKSSDTPVGIVMWASRSNQRVITGTLANINEVVQAQNAKPPALIVIGEVVKLHDSFNYLRFLSQSVH